MARVYSPFAMGSDIYRKQRTYTKEDLIKTKFVFRGLFLVAFMAILSLVYIWSRVQIVQYGYDINNLKAKQHRLVEDNKKLMTQLETLRSPQRIESIARAQLGMISVEPEQIIPLDQEQ